MILLIRSSEIKKKFEVIMNLKIPPLSIQDNVVNDLDSLPREFPTFDDSIQDESITNKKVKTVHRRRDLDSLG
tara:strand:- start:143 stop:361 length:219 start_codon:yes stop_codon:yes gene_type:complete